MTHLLGQAHHAADINGAVLLQVLGPNVDLLVWIPKKPGAETTSTWRPLQLPTCFRRLYGTTIVAIAAPLIEPLLSAGQAAIRGGDCGRNIVMVHRHLEGGPGAAGTGDRALWQQVL